MLVKAQEFVGALKAAELFASEDETRPHLNCVNVEAAGNTLRLVSTDGHTLWACEIAARETAADPSRARTRTSRTWTTAARARPARRGSEGRLTRGESVKQERKIMPEPEDKLEEASRLADRAYYAARSDSKTEHLAAAVRLLIEEVRELREKVAGR
jgi:hypothetical protein